MTPITRAPGNPELIQRAFAHSDRLAVQSVGASFSYRDLLLASERVAGMLLATVAGEGGDHRDKRDLHEARIAFLVPPSFEYVAIQWGVWRAGGLAVPMAVSHPPFELEYVLEDAAPNVLVAHSSLAESVVPLAEARGIPVLDSSEICVIDGGDITRPPLPTVGADHRAMMVYTSGTTGRPKGVVTTHANIEAHVRSLVEAWGWTQEDHILLVLPLHHVHGIVNVLTCALWSGACCQILPRFDAGVTWERLAHGDLTVFMAVPTTYAKLISAWEKADEPTRGRWTAGARKMRLMVSGSAALPVRVLEQWRELTGHTLLERYGMTEIGMALSNPLHGERRPGHVGQPLPGMEVRRVDEQGRVLTDPLVAGEIEVRGPSVFGEYWGRPEETAASFHDGWFRTGDVAVIEDGHCRLLGRKSVDIIKTGGYKVSALEVEEIMRDHPHVQDAAVVGIPDPEWGETVCAAVTPQIGQDILPTEMSSWVRDRLARYKVPRQVRVVDHLPRNAMGKVMKPALRDYFEIRAEDEE